MRNSPGETGQRCRALGLAASSLSLLLALLAAPQPSWAEPPGTKPDAKGDARPDGKADANPDAKADAAGRAHFQRGQRLSAAGDYAAAYREFAAGYAVTRRPLFLFNMAEAARASGEPAKARENYLEFLRVDPGNALSATARTRLDEFDRAAGAATRGASPRPTPTPPTVTTAPEGPREPLPLVPPSATRPQPPGMPGSAPTAPAPAAPPPRDDAPIWKTWPFWAVVGGVIAGGAVVYVATRPTSACGGGCIEVNFR